MMNKKYNLLLPFAFMLVFILGMWIGMKFLKEMQRSGKGNSLFASDRSKKMNQVLMLINDHYVDTVNLSGIEDQAIRDVLAQLDPHSTYIPSEELREVNEPLEGNFDGIGIEFYLLRDTIFVVSALPGGPSEALGIRSGDKIIKIDGKDMAGKKISNTDVVSKLRGPGGTKVQVSIMRKGWKKLIDYSITRGKIPLNSIDAAYLVNNQTGYLKINNFGATTYDEFFEAVTRLKTQGMKNLILDLRGNPGGYLQTAAMIADEFLPDKKLIVYTEGRSQPRKEEHATEQGNFETGKLAILIDEGSASASEIVAGAVQDWDRGTIIGRRSFGKGLVQEQIQFEDGSALRLTIARYYTPTGRCIQKPYGNGLEAYANDLNQRYHHGELTHADSIHSDTLEKFKTPSGKVVYGGGGITPDVFVPIDTTGISSYYAQLVSNDLLREFAYDYADKNKQYFSSFKSFNEFYTNFRVNTTLMEQFISFAGKKGVPIDSKGVAASTFVIKIQLKALIGRQLWKSEAYYRIMQELDNGFKKAMEVLSEK